MREEREERIRRKHLARIAKHREEIRAACSGSLYAFIQEFWSVLEPEQPFVGGWALEAMCLHLEAVTEGAIQYLLMTVPPGMMKSLLVAVFWPAWEWGPKERPSTRYLSSSFSDTNVTRDISKMKRLVESEEFQALWPEVQKTPKWGEHQIRNTKTGFREGRAFSSMTGGRGDRVIIDDPHSVDMAESDTERANTIKTFRESIPDRLNDMRRSAIVVIMQRLHSDDVAGTILKLKLPYVHLNLPMEFERYGYRDDGSKYEVEPCRTYRKDGTLLFEDPRKEEGELLFPERFPREVVDGLKVSKGPYAYSGQYQQRPTAREGGLFKRAYFAGKIITPAEVPVALRLRSRAWDFASQELTPGKPPDGSASVKMGRLGSDYYFLHAEKMFETPGVVEDTVKARAEVDEPGTIIRIPQDPGQAGVDQAARYVKALAGYSVSAVRPTGAKTVRATPLATQAEHGHVYLVNSGPLEEGVDAWITLLLDELCGFPTGPDDLVDAAADAFNELTLGFSGKFETRSAGPRETAQAAPSRDRRYNFSDNDPIIGRGIRSAGAGLYGV